ncbi:hypothetical protein CPARA_2gp201 (nucleomorph) [Cryptomonas paramecium]|uniref:Uncharacterized protein n=1 Tax=Cryptomonas paramaecium TaxID=2898 RepID=F2HHR3_9CRYP|nr:hypothetical protein CPARA_2gp201 [Cryptomonas paramecium]AEA38859.1 hypothetical protein CPARA_2gp201 [Cryptomonas paramecium]
MIFFLVRNFKFAIYINLIIMSKLLYNYTSKNHLKIFNCLYLYTWIIAKKYFIIFRKIANDGYLIPKNFLFNYNIKFLLKTKILYIIGNNITSNYFIWEFLIFFQIRKIECLLSLFDFFFFNILKKKKSNLFKILQVIKFVLTISFEIFFFE